MNWIPNWRLPFHWPKKPMIIRTYCDECGQTIPAMHLHKCDKTKALPKEAE